MAYNATMIFVETPVFTREIRRLLPDEAYRMLQTSLMLRPDAGDRIPGGGGLRKVRWGMAGAGKRGSLRIIYYLEPPDTIYMLLPYRKTAQDDLTPAQLRLLRATVKEWLK